jgi:hypothetical protein
LKSSAHAIQIQSFRFHPTRRWLRSLRRPSVCIGDPICNPATNSDAHRNQSGVYIEEKPVSCLLDAI